MSTPILKTYRQRVRDGEIDDPDFLLPHPSIARNHKITVAINITLAILFVSGIIIVYFTPLGRMAWK